MAYQDAGQGLSTRELRTLLLTGQAVSQEQDTERICHRVGDTAASLLGASLVSISLTPAKQNSPWAVCGTVGDSPFPDTLVDDIARLAEIEWPAHQKSGSLAMLPTANMPPSLTLRGISQLVRVKVRTMHEELGVFIVGKEVPWKLDSREQFVLSTLANQAAVALDNARLRREITERAERLASFNRIIRAITSSLDLQRVFRLLSSEVQPLIPHDRASLVLANPGEQTITVYATAGQGATLGVGTVVPMAGSNVGQVIETGRGFLKTDLEREDNSTQRADLLAPGIRSNIMVPLCDGGVCFGSLNLGSFQVGRYGPDELSLAQEIADQVAVAVIHARLHEEKDASEQRLSKIFEHSNDAIFVIDPEKDEIFDANQKACRMLGYSRDELLSMPISSIHPLEMPKLQAFGQSVFEQGQGWTDELTCTTKSGEVLPSEISASAVDIEGRHCIIAIVRDITERKQAEEAQLELTVMEERSRLAREIHDTLAQSFTAIIWQINAAVGTVEKDSGQASEALERVRNLAQEGLQEARRSVWDLRAGPLGGNTLAKALQQETEKVTGGRDIRTSVDVLGEETVLPSGLEAALLRICQESLANILKHAEATQVSVTLVYDDTKVRLRVEDNGIGFNPDMLGQPERTDGGFGLVSMRERARLIGGELTVTSELGGGTTVDVTLPRK